MAHSDIYNYIISREDQEKEIEKLNEWATKKELPMSQEDVEQLLKDRIKELTELSERRELLRIEKVTLKLNEDIFENIRTRKKVVYKL